MKDPEKMNREKLPGEQQVEDGRMRHTNHEETITKTSFEKQFTSLMVNEEWGKVGKCSYSWESKWHPGKYSDGSQDGWAESSKGRRKEAT